MAQYSKLFPSGREDAKLYAEVGAAVVFRLGELADATNRMADGVQELINSFEFEAISDEED